MNKLSGMGSTLLMAVLVGCGPTDATINSSVKQKLAADETVKSATIDATTQKKVVTLTGTADSLETKDRATAVARQADGVSDVVNQITVAQSGEGPGGPGVTGRGPGMMGNGPGNAGGMGHRGGQGSGGSGQAGGKGSGGSAQPPHQNPE